MRILCLGDTHGELPELDLSRIDLVLHAGDFSCASKNDLYKQISYYESVFSPWVRRVSDHCQIYWISGNHEMFLQDLPLGHYNNDVYQKHNIDNKMVVFKGKNIYGFPWTKRFYNWAFNADDTPEDMGRRCEQIPLEANILLSHGPPYGINDYVAGYLSYNVSTAQTIEIPPLNAGSKELSKYVKKLPNLQLCVTGHLHDDKNYGVVEKDNVKYVGCSIMNEKYSNERDPIIIKIK